MPTPSDKSRKYSETDGKGKSSKRSKVEDDEEENEEVTENRNDEEEDGDRDLKKSKSHTSTDAPKAHYREQDERQDSYNDEGAGGNAQDETLECRDCGQEFVFTVGEQEFYEQKGFTNKPVRCKACKDAKKERMEGGGRNRGFERDSGGRGGGRPNFGESRGGGGGGGGGGVCYAFQRGECDRGSSCRFSHEGGGGGGGNRGGGGGGGGYGRERRDDRDGDKWERGGDSRGDRPPRTGGGGGGGVCYAFQRGECTRGSGCRFSHN